MNGSLQITLQKIAGGIQSNKYIRAITNGLMSAMPATMVGAIGSLINAIPIDAYQSFLVSTGLKEITRIPADITTSLLAIYVVFLVAAKFSEGEQQDGTTAGVIALMAFLIVSPIKYNDFGSVDSLPAFFLGAAGLITSFFVALVSARIYVLFSSKGWTIKMPAGVPSTIAKSFSSLVPGFVICVIFLIVRFGFAHSSYGTIHQFIMTMISTPLTKLGNSFPTLLIAVFVAHALWVCGVHGTLIIAIVFSPVWMTATTANLAAYNALTPLPNLITGDLFSMSAFAGSGMTIGLVVAMLFAKSKRYKTLGKLSIIPNICGINEPVIFGTPIIMNLTLAIPFIFLPVFNLVLAYILMLLNVLPAMPGITSPLGMPVVLHGLMIGASWRWAIFQAVTCVISYFVYKPFFNRLEKEQLAVEQNLEVAND